MIKRIIRISQLSVFLIIVLFGNVAVSQIEVGLIHENGDKANITQTQLMRLNSSRCEVIVPKSMETQALQAMENYWTRSNWSLYTEAERSIQPSDSVCIFTLSVQEGPTAQSPIISLKLRMKDFNEKVVQLAETMLYPDAETITKIQGLNSPEAQRQALFKESKFYNAEGDYLSLNIKAINDQLNKGKSIWFANEYSSKAHIGMLKDNALGIPEYCFFRRNMLSGKDEANDESKLMKHFPYQWEKAENSETRFVFLYAQSGASTYVTIFDTLSGQVIYQVKSSNKFKLTAKDFKNLAKHID